MSKKITLKKEQVQKMTLVQANEVRANSEKYHGTTVKMAEERFQSLLADLPAINKEKIGKSFSYQPNTGEIVKGRELANTTNGSKIVQVYHEAGFKIDTNDASLAGGRGQASNHVRGALLLQALEVGKLYTRDDLNMIIKGQAVNGKYTNNTADVLRSVYMTAKSYITVSYKNPLAKNPVVESLVRIK